MIDCSITENYVKEFNRMCKHTGCGECKFNLINQNEIACSRFVYSKPKQCIEVVQEWSNAHPQKTMRDKFFEMFPEAPKDEDGFPCGGIPRYLGWCKLQVSCLECELTHCKTSTCWNQPYIEKERAK